MNKEINDIFHKKGYGGFLFIRLSIIQFSKLKRYIEQLLKENKKLKDKISKIETLIISHNCDTGDIYYKYYNKFLKSELKQRILEILYEESDNNQ